MNNTNLILRIINNIKYHINKWFFLRAFCSPFKRPKIKFYFGEVKIGVPYFLPRKWRKITKSEVKQKALEAVVNPKLLEKSLEDWEYHYSRYLVPQPLKFGFSFCSLGYKYKYDSIRFEWSPILSFVAFNRQFCIMFLAPDKDYDSSYWESWLYYYRETDKTKTVEERIRQCLEEAPQTWTRHSGDEEITTNHYKHILKDKWAKRLEIQ